MKELIALRKELHRYPEISGAEWETAKRIVNFVQQYEPDSIITGLGRTGVAVVYQYADDGPVVMIRCELDALPIQEGNKFAYRSSHQGISHKCGHDGHMAIVAGLAAELREADFKKGKVILLFQPAEETGVGAKAILTDLRFKSLQPDYIFALHNIPGAPKHQIIWKAGNFTAYVQSVIIRFYGLEAHSAQPELGFNPAYAIAEIISTCQKLSNNLPARRDFRLITPTHITLGEADSYGISAGYGELRLTIRSWQSEIMKILVDKIELIAKESCLNYGLKHNIEWIQYFAATMNDPLCTDIIKQAAVQNKLDLKENKNPFKWGEDFGLFTQKCKGAMFGLGAGEKTPPLHNPDYDFPDEILLSGKALFKTIISLILEN